MSQIEHDIVDFANRNTFLSSIDSGPDFFSTRPPTEPLRWRQWLHDIGFAKLDGSIMEPLIARFGFRHHCSANADHIFDIGL